MGYGGRGSVGGKSRVWDGAKWVETASGIAVPHDTTHSPVALYQLDELLDETSGNALLPLTLVAGTTRYTSIIPGIKGAAFDGTAYYYVNAAESSLLILGDLTIECMVILYETPASGMAMVHHGNAGETENDNVAYALYLSSGGGLNYFAESGAGSDISYSINDALPVGIPVHVALVRSSNNVTFYLNGRQIGATSTGLSAPTGGSVGRFRVGNNAAADQAWEGAIGSVKIINSALTAEEIAAEYNRTLGSAFGEQNLFCYRSATFNGSDEYISMGNVTSFEYNTPFSVSCWFKTSSSGNHIIMSKQNPGSAFRGWSVTINGSNLYFQLVSSYSTLRTEIRSTGTSWADGRWHHAVFAYTAATPGDVSDMDIYVDGVGASTSTVANTLGSNTILNSNTLDISGRNTGETLFLGKLTDNAIYDKALSAAEVEWIYNQGRPQDLRGPGAPSGLVGWWRLGEKASGTTIPDQSVNSNNGTMTNMTIAANITNDVPR